MGIFSLGKGFSTGSGAHALDPRLETILRAAASASPFNVVATSGVANRNAGTQNHSTGHAIDVELIDPSSGKALPNYQNGPAYSAYEQFAQAARVVQQQQFPELGNDFRWGGYFSGSAGKYGAADLMHFDDSPWMHGAMAGGSWGAGLTPQQLKLLPGAKSDGGLAQPLVRSQIESALAGHPVPPANVPSAPFPAFSPTLSTRNSLPPPSLTSSAPPAPVPASPAPYSVSYGPTPPQTDILKGQVVGAMSHPGNDVLQPVANALSGLAGIIAPPRSAPSPPPTLTASLPPPSLTQSHPNGGDDMSSWAYIPTISPLPAPPSIRGTELDPSSIGLPDSINGPMFTGQGIAGTAQMPAGVRPNVVVPKLPVSNSQSWADLLPKSAFPAQPFASMAGSLPSPTQAYGSVLGGGPLTGGQAPDARSVPNAYQQAMMASPDNGGWGFAFPSAPPPLPRVAPQAIPAAPAPVWPMSPPQSELAALRQQAMNPLQRLFAASPIGNIGTYLASGAYGAPLANGLLGLLPRPSLPAVPNIDLFGGNAFASAGNRNASAAANSSPGGSLTGYGTGSNFM